VLILFVRQSEKVTRERSGRYLQRADEYDAVEDRIAPLFKMDVAPRTLTPADITSFPVLAPDVTLRVDMQLRWRGNENLEAGANIDEHHGMVRWA
jgi:hypothetical protein